MICFRPNQNVQDRNLLRDIHSQGQRANGRHRQLFCYTKLTFSRFMFRTIMHITLIRQDFKTLDNIWKILHTFISNAIPCFLFPLPYIGIDTQRSNQPMSWSSLILFWFWRCDFHLLQTTKFQRDVQGDVLITIINISVFPNIFNNHNFPCSQVWIHQVWNFPPIFFSKWSNHVKKTLVLHLLGASCS